MFVCVCVGGGRGARGSEEEEKQEEEDVVRELRGLFLGLEDGGVALKRVFLQRGKGGRVSSASLGPK